jgi:DNA polymerase elongation subunit (family B)
VKLPGNVGLEEARLAAEYWERRARDTAGAYFGEAGWVLRQLGGAPKWVLGVSEREAEDMAEDRPSERVGRRFLVEFAHPRLVKMFAEYALYCRGREADPRVPTWCESRRWAPTFGRALVYEAGADYVERVIADRDLSPCSWYRLRAGPAARAARTRDEPLEYDPGGKRYDLVARAHADDLEPSGAGADEEPPPARVLAFDIEAENQNGDRMCRYATDPVLSVAAYLYETGAERGCAAFAFEVGSCDPQPGARVFFYRDDRALLSDFRKFVIRCRCDVLAAHNGNGFDLPYLVSRAKHLGLGDWDLLGPLRRRARFVTSVNRGFARHAAYVPGLLVVDTMLVELGTLGQEGVSLADCARRYLGGAEKMDVHPDEITRLQRTHVGRTKKHKYCLRDAELVMRVEAAQSAVASARSVARMSVCPQQILNRGQGVKIEAHIARAAARASPPMVMLSSGFAERARVGRPAPPPRAGYGGPKGYEGAINLRPTPLYLAPGVGPRRAMVFTLDFAALYPSIIRRHNVSPDTLVRDDAIAAAGWVEGAHYWRSRDYSEGPDGRRVAARNPANPAFVASEVRRGLLPRIQDSLAAWRARVKLELAAEKLKPPSPAGAEVARRLSLLERSVKLFQNAMYGLMGRGGAAPDSAAGSSSSSSSSSSSGARYVSVEVASTITREGRGLILLARDVVLAEFPGSRVVGGDTDSIFVLAEVGDDADAWRLGKAMEAAINLRLEDPVRIEFENAAVAFLQWRKKNYEKLVREPLAGGGWTAPRLVVKGESWIKRNFPRNLKRACREVCGLLLTSDARPDRLGELRAKMRELASGLARYRVPVGDLVESTRLGKPIGAYASANKAAAMLRRKHEADVRAARRRLRDRADAAADPAAAAAAPPRRRKRRRGDSDPDPLGVGADVDVPEPEVGTVASYVILPRSERRPSAKVSDRAAHALDAIRDDSPYDVEYYLEQLLRTLSSSFGQAVVEMRGLGAAVDAAVAEAEKAARSKHALSDAVEEKADERARAARKAEYLRAVRDFVGRLPGARRLDPTSGIARFFRRQARCPTCAQSRCSCDLAEARAAKLAEIAALGRGRAASWAACAKCVGGVAREAESCISYRSCPNFSLRYHLDHAAVRAHRELADLEDLALERRRAPLVAALEPPEGVD